MLPQQVSVVIHMARNKFAVASQLFKFQANKPIANQGNNGNLCFSSRLQMVGDPTYWSQLESF